MTTSPATDVEAVVRKVRQADIDRTFLPQESLDVTIRSKVSALPWRGQFTPDLARTLLRAYTKPGDRILDPFVGSGTTLSEAIELGLACIGCEINPAAVELSRIFETATLPVKLRTRKIKALAIALTQLTDLSDDDGLSLFSSLNEDTSADSTSPLDRLLDLRQESADPWLANAVAVSLMIAMGNGKTLDRTQLSRSFNQVIRLLSDLPRESVSCEVHAADARCLPIDSKSIDFVLTSPPYINVFNYHQNYRPAVELLGYDVLYAAQREIGSNRKFRQNRFMTAVQYCLDMMLALRELARVCLTGSKVVVVVGRESRVRGVPLENGVIVSSLAELSGALQLVRWQERSFTSRFGERIFEEILTLEVSDASPLSEDVALKLASETGRLLLSDALAKTEAPPEIIAEMKSAIDVARDIKPSLFEEQSRPGR
jgi:hypothetical protein